jgi:phosphoribosylaminoimidazole carboxylase PurE protein
MRVIIIMGSPSDRPIAERVVQGLADFDIPAEMRVASAHKVPEYVLAMLDAYEADDEPTVYVTIAGRSNALSGLIDGRVKAPVIACPPYSDKFAGGDIYSSLRMPSGVVPAVVMSPENAALLAAKMLALAEPDLKAKLEQVKARHRQRLYDADTTLRQT